MQNRLGTEEELCWIGEAKAGNSRAFARLVERYQRPVYNLCYRMLGNGPEAEDAAQETFLRVFSRLKTYDERHKFSSWLLSIGSHYCIDCLRRRRFVSLNFDELAPVLPSQHDEQPERATLRDEAAADVQRMVDRLPPLYRNIVVLRYWHHLSYDEIGRVLSISESAVKSRLHRARKALANALLAQGEPEKTSRSVAPVRG